MQRKIMQNKDGGMREIADKSQNAAEDAAGVTETSLLSVGWRGN